MIVRTENFNPNSDTKLRCTCSHKNCDSRSVNQKTLNSVQLIRDDLGIPMVVTSGGRCPYHPKEIGKRDSRDHQMMTTVDIKCDNEMFETKLKVLAGRHGATRVAGGAYCGFVHMSWTKTNRDDVPTWGY